MLSVLGETLGQTYAMHAVGGLEALIAEYAQLRSLSGPHATPQARG
jgi:hypothetical protein